MTNNLFHLIVRSHEGLLYEGDVNSVTSYNEKGKFDVLAGHANFISLIQKRLIIQQSNGKNKEVEIDNALLRVRENMVEVYVGIEGMGSVKSIETESFEVK